MRLNNRPVAGRARIYRSRRGSQLSGVHDFTFADGTTIETDVLLLEFLYAANIGVIRPPQQLSFDLEA